MRRARHILLHLTLSCTFIYLCSVDGTQRQKKSIWNFIWTFWSHEIAFSNSLKSVFPSIDTFSNVQMMRSQTHPFADHVVVHIYTCAAWMAYRGKKNQFETSVELSDHMKLYPPIRSNPFVPSSNQYMDSCKVANFQWRRSHAQGPVNSPFSFFFFFKLIFFRIPLYIFQIYVY
jgi:hypothetical protein